MWEGGLSPNHIYAQKEESCWKQSHSHVGLSAGFFFFSANVPAAKNGQLMWLLISCTSGVTSSYFAYTMKNAMNKAGLEIIIDAISITEIHKIHSQYDYILLAPQVAYALPEYRKKYGD